MQSKVVQWYHYYLQHPGKNRLEETIVAIMWWRGMQPHMKETHENLRTLSIRKTL